MLKILKNHSLGVYLEIRTGIFIRKLICKNQHNSNLRNQTTLVILSDNCLSKHLDYSIFKREKK